MKKTFFLFSLLFMGFPIAGCGNTAEKSSMPTIDTSTEQTMKKLQQEEDQAMHLNVVSPANAKSLKCAQ